MLYHGTWRKTASRLGTRKQHRVTIEAESDAVFAMGPKAAGNAIP